MKRPIFYMLIMGVFLSSVANAQTKTLLQQRWQFKEAHQVLLKEDLNTFEQLLAQLQDYPIAHYLRYFYLESHLENAETIRAFLAQYKDTPIAQSLRQAWLTQLAKKGDWQTFIANYTPQKSTVLQCYHLQAHFNTQGELKGKLLNKAKDLWLVGISQPDECDPVFAILYDNEQITNEMRWQRIRLAMQKGNLKLARFIANGLPEADQDLVTLWQELHNNPATALNGFQLSDTPLAREMLLHGLRRLARKDAGSAYKYWKNCQTNYAFSKQENAELFHYIALKSVRQNHPEAARWLAEVDKDLVDERIIQTRLQMALAQQDWQAVTKLIQSLPAAQRDKLQFQYWQARALEQTGATKKAEKRFEALSQNRDYYGFLAADRLGKPYDFQSHPLNISKEEQNQLFEKQAGMLRARELYFIGLASLARAEWQAVLSSLSTSELKIAAALAHQWGWHDRAIIAIAKAKYYDDLKIRFPLPFYDTVLKHAEARQLDFAHIYAMIRQESAFQTDAISVAGALGLMQLMPETAKQVAKKQQVSIKTTEELFVPDINIDLGTAYLRDLLNKFNGNHLLATAGYNAGPSRAKQWAKKYGCLSPDIWIELIPFNETRKYVQRVLSYMPVFEYLMVGHSEVKPMPLDAILAEECSNNK
jgi:soluble lytic murein transglycosylase